MKSKPSILERMSTLPKIPVPVMSAMPDESSTGIAAIAAAARIALSENPSSGDATSMTTKGKSSPSITGAPDPAAWPKSANSYWDNSNPPSPVRTLPPHGPSRVSLMSSENLPSLEENDLELTRQMQWSSAQEAGAPQASLPVSLTLSSELWAHLMTVADGRGQSLDDMLSERIAEFRELYGLI